MNNFHCFVLFLLLVIFIIYLLNSGTKENFVPGKACTNEHALNFTNPIKLVGGTVSDDCTCDFPQDKVVCSRYFATNYREARYSNEFKRCHDKNAYNFELNSKIPDNSLCTYENNEICIFPTNLTNVNSLFEIIDNPDEYMSLIENDKINYNNILRAGPCVPKNKHRSEKLDLYFRLFNRHANTLSMSNLDPAFNIWDVSGKVTVDQLRDSYDKILRTFDFTEDGLSTTIEVKCYGADVTNDLSYVDLVNKLNTGMLSDRIKHVALAVSLDCKKYAIGIGNSKDAAMDIAMISAMLFDNNVTDTNTKLEVNRSYTRMINIMKKSQRMTLDEYDKIKKDIADNKIVDEESKLTVLCRDKMIENVNNPIGILMVNNNRYFKYPNDPNILNKCQHLVKDIESKCFDNTDIKGIRNCNEVIMLRHDNSNNKCSIIQQQNNIINNSKYNLSDADKDILVELTHNVPIKLVNSLLSESGCGKNNVDCFIYSINDKRFCKE